MDVDDLVRVLKSHRVPEKVTEFLITEFENTTPYLPVLDPSDLWDIVDASVIHDIEEVLDGDFSYNDFTWKLFKALEFAVNSPLRSIFNTRKGSHSNVLYDPKEYLSRTLITTDFIDYVVGTGNLTPYAVKELERCLRRNHIDHPVGDVEIPEPKEDELMAVVFAGLLRMAQNKPNVFQREVAIAMRERGIDVSKYTRTTMLNAVKDAKIIPG